MQTVFSANPLNQKPSCDNIAQVANPNVPIRKVIWESYMEIKGHIYIYIHIHYYVYNTLTLIDVFVWDS